MKLVGGQWQRISWDQAINEIGDKLIGHPREVRRRFGVLARLGQVHQRGRLSVPEVRRLLGHQLGRPSGAHLPLDDGRRRRQHLGLRRPDQLLQRHPQRQDHDHHGRQPGRGAPGRDAAPPGRQGDQPRQHDRRSIRGSPAPPRTPPNTCASAPAPTSRCSGACCGTSSRTAGRTRNSSASASTAWTTSARRSPSGRPTRSSASPACRASS